MSITRIFRGTAMDLEQERKFEQVLEQRCWRYFLPIGISIILFEIYNIIYALHYTDFRLDTRASRVYMVFYLILLTVTVAAIVLRNAISGRRGKEGKSRLCLRIYQVYGLILLFWAARVTVYDQRVSDNLNVYMSAALAIAVLVYMEPLFSVCGFLLAEALLLTAMPYFQPGGMLEHYGTYINSVVLAVIASAISIYRYSTVRSDFQKQELIARQNREILRKSEELNYVANHDALTGLWNRRFLEICLSDQCYGEKRQETAVLMIDIDYFKQYNDTYGHLQGDECLRRVPSALNLVVSKGRLFRYGGEEFLCVVPEFGEKQARKLGEEFCRSIERLGIPAADPEKNVTVSVGMAVGTIGEREEFEALLEKADEALYQAKNSGRNRVV
ncbi:MAG: GGDEF domain-containing protein [Lacrimispora saccharolytica]